MATHVSLGRAELMMMILTGDRFYPNAENLLSILILQFVLFMHVFHLLYFVSNDNNKDVQSIARNFALTRPRTILTVQYKQTACNDSSVGHRSPLTLGNVLLIVALFVLRHI